MICDWEDISLTEIIDIKHGFAFKGEFFHSEPRSDVVITPGNFSVGGGYQEKKLKYYDGPVPEGYTLNGGDLVVTMTDLSKRADTLGFAAVVPFKLRYRLLHNQRIGLVKVKKPKRVLKEFLHWLMRSKPYRDEILASASGSTVRHTSPSRILAFRFFLPPLDEQKRIAAVLGALDDKIELNRKMNQTLEEIAQAIFKSWFIDFDGVPEEDLVDSELGPIPRGWELLPVNQIVQFNPRTILKKGSLAKFVEMKALSTSSCSVSGVAEKVLKSGGSKFVQGDTLFARITPCLENGKTALVDFLAPGEVAFGSTEFIVMRAEGSVSKEWVYCLARSQEFRHFAISNMTGSSGRQRVPVGCFEHFFMPCPPNELLVRFEEVTLALFEKIKRNTDESIILVELRDALLPKLISGELRVPEAEKQLKLAL